MRIILVVLCFAVGIGWAHGQNQTSRRYPNELSAFRLWSKYGLTGLNPGVSGTAEIDAVLGNVMDKCDAPWHGGHVGGCKLDENWDVSYTQIETRSGNLNSVIFYPRKRIPFSSVRFPKTFEKGGMMIVHLIEPEEFIEYSDKSGLKYVVVNEGGDSKYKKGDLFYIEYGPTTKHMRLEHGGF